jgi:hypothetical protein
MIALAIASQAAVIDDPGMLVFEFCEYEDGEMAWIEGSREVAPVQDPYTIQQWRKEVAPGINGHKMYSYLASLSYQIILTIASGDTFERPSVYLPRVTLWCEHLSGIAPGVNIARELLLRIKLLVLALCPPLGDQTGDDCQAASSDDDTTASLVSWLLRSQEEVWSEPMGNLQTLLELVKKRSLKG